MRRMQLASAYFSIYFACTYLANLNLFSESNDFLSSIISIFIVCVQIYLSRDRLSSEPQIVGQKA